MPRSTRGSGFDALLAQLARAPDAVLEEERLPEGVQSATLIGDRYRIKALIGRGGMGEVYEATDIELDRPVAIKMPRARLGPAGQRRWLREAEALARLSHPNVVEVFAVGTQAERPYIAMERVQGETLGDWALGGGRPWAEVLDRYRQAGMGLAAAHAAGLVHRDFKPDNVLVGVDGRVRVVDFGLAALGASPRIPSPTGRTVACAPGEERETVSRLSRGVGTVGFMAPEQFVGQAPDRRSDQFSFCAALFEGLFGRLPFRGATAALVWERTVVGDLSVPAGTDVPRWLVRALRRGLRPAAAQRYADMHTLLAALEPRRHQRFRRRAAAGVVAATIAAGVWWQAARPSQRSCDSAAQEIDDSWNAARSQELTAAYAATESPLAVPASQHAVTTLNAYVSDWSVRRRAVCERSVEASGDATRETVAPRIACLERARINVQGVVEALAGADRTVVANTRAVLAALPKLEICDQTRPFAELALPTQRAAEQQVRTSRRLIAGADALRRSGSAREALDRAEEALTLARKSAYDPVVAEALLGRGLAVASLNGPHAAVADLKDAYWVATAARHDAAAATAARNVLMNIVSDLRGWDEATQWWKMAEAAEQRLGGDGKVSSELWRARARAAHRAERFDEARRGLEAALEAQEAEGVAVIRRAPVLSQLSELEYVQGDSHAALRWADEAIALARANLPDGHPMYAQALGRRAQALAAERPAEAIEPARESLSILRRLYGPTAPTVVEAIVRLGEVLTRSEDPDAAITTHREALEIVLARDERNFYEEATTRYSLAKALLGVGRIEDAKAMLVKAAAAYEAVGGTEAYNRGLVFVTLGEAHIQLGDHDAAVATLERAIEIIEPMLPYASPQLAGTLYNRGAAHLAQDNPAAALADFDDAAERLGERPSSLVAMAQDGRAMAYLALEQPQRAAQAAERSLEVMRALNPDPNPALVRAHSMTGGILRRAGEHARAREVFLRGLSTLDQTAAQGDLEPRMLLELAKATCALGDGGEARRLATQAIDTTRDEEALATIRAWLKSSRAECSGPS